MLFSQYLGEIAFAVRSNLAILLRNLSLRELLPRHRSCLGHVCITVTIFIIAATVWLSYRDVVPYYKSYRCPKGYNF